MFFSDTILIICHDSLAMYYLASVTPYNNELAGINFMLISIAQICYTSCLRGSKD